ncbi:MAG: hypothetical protein WC273_10680 [Dehalococcoidia bacterium]
MTPIAFATIHLLNPEQPTAHDHVDRPTIACEAGNSRVALTFADRATALAWLSAAMECIHALTPAADDLPVMP